MLNVVRSALKEFDSKPFIQILDGSGPIPLDVGPISLDPFERSLVIRHFVDELLWQDLNVDGDFDIF